MERPCRTLALLYLLWCAASCRTGASADPQPPPGQSTAGGQLQLEVDPSVIDDVEVVGDLPGAPLKMRSPRAGLWTLDLDGLVRGQIYRYRFRAYRKDSARWIEVSDPTAWLLDASKERYALLRAGAPFAPDPPPAYNAPRLGDLILYELCPREFVPKDTPYAHPRRHPGATGPGLVLRRITDRIREGYFDQLGINALELMPLMASAWTGWRRARPERDPWGYLPLSWYALNGDYGSPEDLVELVREAHRHDLAVIMDISLDHGYGAPGGSEAGAPGVPRYGTIVDLFPSWRRPSDNRWGLMQLDVRRPDVRRFLVNAVRRLLTTYGIDGLRMDWTEKVPWESWAPLVKQIRRIKPDVLLISENPVADLVARAGFDGTWDFFFHWEAPLLLRQVYKNFDGVAGRFVDTQTKLVENLTRWARGPAPPGPLVRYIESHDLPRIARRRVRWQHGGDRLMDVDGDGRMPDWLEHGGPAATRLGATLLMTVPGAPLIFAGQEFGAHDILRWRYDPLDWSDPDPLTYAHYRRLIRLRRKTRALRSDDLRILRNDTVRHVLVYSRGMDMRRIEDDLVVVALNFASRPRRVHVPLPSPGPWRDVLGGPGCARRAGLGCTIELPPRGSAVLLRAP